MAQISYRVNTMAADDLAPSVTRSSAAMILIQFSCNIPASAPEELTKYMGNVLLSGINFNLNFRK